MTEKLCWLDGRIAPVSDGLLRPDDAAFSEGRGCFTTARWTGRGVRFEARHLARLARDARALGVGAVDAEAARRGFLELGSKVFGPAEGVIRLQASRDGEGRVRLLALARALGAEPAAWRAITLPFAHPGPAPWGGAKVSGRLLYALGGDAVREAGADEGLLLDAHGRLVEGTRTNLVAVAPDGAPRFPPASRGAVAGVALEVAREGIPELEGGDCTRAGIGALRELVALNAVRGAVAVVEIDDRPVGAGEPGPWSRRLAAALDAAG